MAELGVIEVTEHIALAGLLHGKVVVRALPETVLVWVALGAAAAAGELGAGRGAEWIG